MAGGKETPRQKMIGMMYLVLTAMLALNVSKEILDAFVAIEENTQKSALTQLQRGNAALSELSGELADKTNPAKVEKVKYLVSIISDIDKETAKKIVEIDQLKEKMLVKVGEDLKQVKNNDEKIIVWEKYSANNPLKPTRFNLYAVGAKDNYDIPMEFMVGEDLKSPKKDGEGMKLWNSLIGYRSFLVDKLGSYKDGEKVYSFKSTAINSFKDNKDLDEQVDAMVKKAGANLSKEDVDPIKQIYKELSKQERVDMKESKGVHWLGKTFDHSPLVAAIASLTVMQQEILAARATAIITIKNRVTTGEYSFNTIMPLAYGPMIANANDDITLKVMMAAFDSDNQPTVTSTSGSVTETKDGVGYVKVKVSSGSEMKISGTVSIKNKSGVSKTENWTHSVVIMKPQGTVSLPEMNMLYRGYDNQIQGVASGFEQTILTGNGVDLTKTANGYIGRVPAGNSKTCSINIAGKNSSDNKTQTLGTFQFRVSNLPPAQVYFGKAGNGEQGSKFDRNLFAKYPPEIPLAVNFSVTSWEMEFMGRSARGTSSTISEEAQNLLKQARPGSTVTFIVRYVDPAKTNRMGVVAVKL